MFFCMNMIFCMLSKSVHNVWLDLKHKVMFYQSNKMFWHAINVMHLVLLNSNSSLILSFLRKSTRDFKKSVSVWLKPVPTDRPEGLRPKCLTYTDKVDKESSRKIHPDTAVSVDNKQRQEK